LNARGKQNSAQDESYWDSSRLQRIVTSFEMHDGQDARRSTGCSITGGGEKQNDRSFGLPALGLEMTGETAT